MNFLFIYSSLPIGGIETFFCRIAKVLSKNNHTVKFLFYGSTFDSNLLKELNKYSEIYYYRDFIHFSLFFEKRTPLIKLLAPKKSRKINSELLDGITHIHAPDFNSILFANRIIKTNSDISITTGIYHINEFYFKGNEHWYFNKINTFILNHIPPENVFMYNEIVQKKYNELYGNRFKNNELNTIGVDIEAFESVHIAQQNLRIVSIGRLTPWKKYNNAIIDVIKDYKEKGINLKYDSYGDGNELNHLRDKVAKNNLTGLIHFYPSIPYTDFQKVISNSLMFIGAGTALIEASACGLPSLIGVENEDEPVSYGFLHDTSSYTYQEKELGLPTKSFTFYIDYLLSLSPDEYRLETEKAKERAVFFSLKNAGIKFESLTAKSKKWGFKISYFKTCRVLFSFTLNKVLKKENNYSKRL